MLLRKPAALSAAALFLCISALVMSTCGNGETDTGTGAGQRAGRAVTGERTDRRGNGGGAAQTPDATRADQAKQLTYGSPASSQNPVFSPDGAYIIYTRFRDGYNSGPSELVKMRVDGGGEQVIVPAGEFSNVNVPYGSWVGESICFSSDRGGGADEIWLAAGDGSGPTQVSFHDEDTETYYIEPVFNPRDPGWIIFEHVTGQDDAEAVHRLALLDVESGRVILLTDGSFDDRLPSWSPDGKRLLFQRNEYGRDEGWTVYVADIDTAAAQPLSHIRAVSGGDSDDTDCSWSHDGGYALASSNHGGLPVPNIFLFPVDMGSPPVRVTSSDENEDGAPSQSPDGRWLAFESHSGQDEQEPAEIFIIRVP